MGLKCVIVTTGLWVTYTHVDWRRGPRANAILAREPEIACKTILHHDSELEGVGGKLVSQSPGKGRGHMQGNDG